MLSKVSPNEILKINLALMQLAIVWWKINATHRNLILIAWVCTGWPKKGEWDFSQNNYHGRKTLNYSKIQKNTFMIDIEAHSCQTAKNLMNK